MCILSLLYLPWDKHGFPLGMLFTPWTAKVPVSSISSTVFLSSCTSSTVPCIHTMETSRERPLPGLIAYASPLGVLRCSAVLSWPDNTLTGGGRFFSSFVLNMITCRWFLTEDGKVYTVNLPPNIRLHRKLWAYFLKLPVFESFTVKAPPHALKSKVLTNIFKLTTDLSSSVFFIFHTMLDGNKSCLNMFSYFIFDFDLHASFYYDGMKLKYNTVHSSFRDTSSGTGKKLSTFVWLEK